LSPLAFEGRWWPNVKLAGVRVLVVDDNPDARELMQVLLAGCGATVDVAGGAREGFDAFLRERPSLIVSDIEMPGEDGRWLMRQIRALPPEAGGDTPIMAVTASVAKPSDASDFQAWLLKPQEPPEICQCVCELIDASRSAKSWMSDHAA
jgi:CheY-like chemotaxis protein